MDSTSEKNASGCQWLNVLTLIGEVLLLLIQMCWITLEATYRLIVPIPEKSVEGEIVLITGAGHGIGRELALQYASHGAIVVCCDINEEANQQTANDICALKFPKAHAYRLDVSNRSEVFEIIDKVQRDVGDITILINNAGIMPTHPLLEHTDEEIERIMKINVLGHFWTIQAVLPSMQRHNNGHIVAISSCCGQVGLANLVPYCSSKFAVRGLMDALHNELYQYSRCNIKLTTIYPFIVDTGLCKKAILRFPSFTKILDPKHVAECVISAQRRDVFETTVPRHLLSLFYYTKIYPIEVNRMINDFLGVHVESDF